MIEGTDLGDLFVKVASQAQVQALRDAADAVPVDLWCTYGMANRLHVEGFQEWLRERADRMEKEMNADG